MTLIPAPKLLSGASYTVTVTGGAKGVKDLAGNALAARRSGSSASGSPESSLRSLRIRR